MRSDMKSFELMLGEGFDHAGWHGPSLLTALRGMSVDELLFRPRADSHNAWELALHCAYWKHAIRNRILGGQANTFALDGANFFPRNAPLTASDWKKDLAMLKGEHKALHAVVLKLDPRALDRKLKVSRHSARLTALGIAAHDIYHAGQISLLKKLSRA